MNPLIEKRLLQAAILVGGAFSLFVATASVIDGLGVIGPDAGPANRDLDSHFRYLSGIFLAALIGLYSCVPAIENKGPRFRLLGALVVCGGLARLIGAFAVGIPGRGHVFGLGMELIVTPLLILWQARVAGRFAVPDARGR